MNEKTVDEKRAYAREHLLSQMKEARSIAAYHQANAEARHAFAAYCERRAATVEQIEEIELDLMIASWRGEVRTEKARVAMFGEQYHQERMLRSYDSADAKPTEGGV